MKTISHTKQDLFVVNYLKKINNRIFVDISASNPLSMESTYLLESKYDWDVISRESDSSFDNLWANRKTKPLIQMHLKLSIKDLIRFYRNINLKLTR